MPFLASLGVPMRRSMLRTSTISLLSLLIAAVTAVPALAVPGNDDFASATVLTPPQVVNQSTAGATTEAGEPAPSCSTGGATVWFSVSVADVSLLHLSTFGSKYDTVLAAYEGTGLGDLTEVACNDDIVATGSLQSKLTLEAEAGDTFYIQVDGYLGATGDLKLTIEQELGTNDDFQFATEIGALPFTHSQSTIGATTEPGEQDPCFTGVGSTLWFRYTPSEDQDILVDTATSEHDTVLAVYTGSDLGSLSVVACNDDVDSLQARLSFAASAGVTYHIQAGGFGGDTGQLELLVDATDLPDPPEPPANDDFADRETIALGDTLTVDTLGATEESGEQAPCGEIASTVWYEFTPAEDEAILINTRGSDFDTALAVYTGTELADLALVGCNDDASGLTSEVSFNASAGETYYVQVGGFFGETGVANVRVRRAPLVDLLGLVRITPTDAGVEVCVTETCLELP